MSEPTLRLRLFKYDTCFCACQEREIFLNFNWNLATEARERRLKDGKTRNRVRQGRTKETQRLLQIKQFGRSCAEYLRNAIRTWWKRSKEN